MNERLRFSWGHIIAFIALIIVSYVSFVGFTYLSNGNFIFGACGMAVTDIMFLFVFIGAQQLKSSEKGFAKKIKWERALIFGSPLIFAAGMVAMSHFWTVKSRNDAVVDQFNNALTHGQGIFDEYKAYANNRIETYSKNLDKIISMKNSNPILFRQAGFQAGLENMQKENMVEVLKLQLLNGNYDSLQLLANKWIEKAHNGASTLNVFLLGNTREIRDALINWENQLKGFTEKRLSNEQLLGEVAAFETTSGSTAAREIDSLESSFTRQAIPTWSAIVFGIIIYLMMIFPYFIQERHSKSVYRLMGKEGRQNHNESEAGRYVESFDDEISVSGKPGKTEKSVTAPTRENDFPSF